MNAVHFAVLWNWRPVFIQTQSLPGESERGEKVGDL